MPPRKSIARRKKPSKAESLTEDDEIKLSIQEPQQQQVVTDDPLNSDPTAEGVVIKDEDEDDEPEEIDEDANVVNVSQSETVNVTEIISAQEETTVIQADDTKIVNDNNVVESHDDKEVEDVAEVISAQESSISKSPSKNNNSLPVEDAGNEDLKGTPDTVVGNESAQAATTEISRENKTAQVVEDDSKENVGGDDHDDVNDNNNEGDAAANENNGVLSVVDDKKDQDMEIYVGKLDKDIVEDDLVNVFQQFGELKSTRIVRNRGTNKSKGFAFVRFASVEQAKRVLSELKDGVEVKGKLVKISASQNNRTLFLGNISKTWSKEEVLQQLTKYGIEHLETIRVPGDNKKVKPGNKNSNKKLKGFAFLEFETHSDAAEAFQRLKKPDAVFGRDVSAKVAFAQTNTPSADEDVSRVNRVHVQGLAKGWNEEKVKEICEKYGEIVKINLHQSSKAKHTDFGFITFSSPEIALACVEGINNSGMVGDSKIIASIAKPTRTQKQVMHGGSKVGKQNGVTKLNKEGDISKKNSEPKSLKMKGSLNSEQAKSNGKDSSKTKVKSSTVKPQQKGLVNKQNSGGVVKAEKQSQPSPLKKDGESSNSKGKRKASSERNLSAPPDSRHGVQGTPKKPKRVGEGENSKTVSKSGNNKRKKATTYEGREDRVNRNAQGRNSFKKQKGSMHGRERDHYRNPISDTRVIGGHDDYRNSTRYVDPYGPTYAASTPATYHLGSDSLSIRRQQEMEPHAGYIPPASAKQSQSYSGYIQPVDRTPLRPHQTVYLEPASTSQSQIYSRYLDPPATTQSHRRYIETPVVPEPQPYRGYRQPEYVQIAHDPYGSGLARVVRQDGRGSGVLSYAGGPSVSASQAQNPPSYYQGGSTYSGAYSGAYGLGRPYY